MGSQKYSHLINLNRGDASRQHFILCRCYSQIEVQPSESMLQKSVELLTDQNNKLTPQQIILMMGAMIAVFSSLFMTFVWYIGAVPLEDLREQRQI